MIKNIKINDEYMFFLSTLLFLRFIKRGKKIKKANIYESLCINMNATKGKNKLIRLSCDNENLL